MSQLQENRLISYRVIEVLPDDFQMWLWILYRKLEVSYGKQMRDIQEFMIIIQDEFIVVTIFEDHSHARQKICYSNTFFELPNMSILLNVWKLCPYVIMDIISIRYEDGGGLDAR